MGLNYALVVSTLFEFRKRLGEFKTARNGEVLKYFDEADFDPYDEDARAPQLKEIAQAIGLPTNRVNVIVKDLYNKLIESFADKPIEIGRTVVTIYIGHSWEERQEMEGNKHSKEFLDREISIDVNMPHLPRVGEDISLQFLDRNQKFTHGCVHEITHELTGNCQRITLTVHPYHNYYFKWVELREKYDNHRRMVRQIDSERRSKM